eukprot:g19563.t1
MGGALSCSRRRTAVDEKGGRGAAPAATTPPTPAATTGEDPENSDAEEDPGEVTAEVSAPLTCSKQIDLNLLSMEATVELSKMLPNKWCFTASAKMVNEAGEELQKMKVKWTYNLDGKDGRRRAWDAALLAIEGRGMLDDVKVEYSWGGKSDGVKTCSARAMIRFLRGPN